MKKIPTFLFLGFKNDAGLQLKSVAVLETLEALLLVPTGKNFRNQILYFRVNWAAALGNEKYFSQSTCP